MSDNQKAAAARHPIRVVAERTGLSPHVLRAWERRYGVVAPTRSDGGQRFYTDDDIHRLSLLVKASQVGRSVGSVALLPTSELARLVAQDADQGQARPSQSSDHRAMALKAVRDMAPDRLQSLLRRALLSLGTPVFLDQVLSPLLVDIGSEWHAGRIGIVHEHAASAAVQQLLGWLIRELDVLTDAPSVLLATPSGQRHSQGAMIAAAAAAHDGWHAVWLGADLPATQIATAAREHGVDVVGLSVTTTDDLDGLRSELLELRVTLAPNTPLYVGGLGAGVLERLDGIGEARDLAHWRSILRTHAPASHTAAA